MHNCQKRLLCFSSKFFFLAHFISSFTCFIQLAWKSVGSDKVRQIRVFAETKKGVFLGRLERGWSLVQPGFSSPHLLTDPFLLLLPVWKLLSQPYRSLHKPSPSLYAPAGQAGRTPSHKKGVSSFKVQLLLTCLRQSICLHWDETLFVNIAEVNKSRTYMSNIPYIFEKWDL